jgi:hypothetical protein
MYMETPQTRPYHGTDQRADYTKKMQSLLAEVRIRLGPQIGHEDGKKSSSNVLWLELE